MKTISPEEAQEKLKDSSKALLVDVRTPAEYGALKVPCSVLAPVQSLDVQKFLGQHPEACEREVLLMCRAGSRAKAAAEKFKAAGHDRIAVIEGGILAWEAAGLEVEKGTSKVIPVDRQVRIAIGLGIILFTILGYTVHPLLFLGAGAMGCGLVFAGITDLCPLALLVAAMPWNQGGGPSCPLERKTTN